MTNLLRTVFASLLIAAVPSAASAADEPPHTVVSEEGSIQIRDYEAMIVAEVEVSGDMARAGNAGFRPLAGYIFGGNQARDGGSAEIAMTSPVTQTRSQEIAMTTPVTQSRTDDDSWRVAFVMPPEWTLDTLPTPDDPGVSLREQPARRMAIIRFNGGSADARFASKEMELREYLISQGMETRGEAVYARYDPPWIPTPFRRNEVMVELVLPEAS